MQSSLRIDAALQMEKLATDHYRSECERRNRAQVWKLHMERQHDTGIVWLVASRDGFKSRPWAILTRGEVLDRDFRAALPRIAAAIQSLLHQPNLKTRNRARAQMLAKFRPDDPDLWRRVHELYAPVAP